MEEAEPKTKAPERPLKAWEEEVLKPGAKVFFQAMHPRYGRAEFEFCHVFKRGKLQTVYVYPKQQKVPNIYYRIDCHGHSEFCIGSWEYKGIDEPRVWKQFYCREHKGFVTNVYVPKNANHFVVGYNDVHFGMEIQMTDSNEPTPVSLGACRGGPTLALSDVANGVEEECVLCRMIVRADQVEHPVLGFKARCEK